MSLTFVYGDETYLVEEHVRAFKTTHASLSLDVFKEVFDLDNVLRSVTTQDMFSSGKCVIMVNPFFLFQRLDDAVQVRLEHVLDSAEKSDYPILIVALGKKVDGRKKVITRLKKIAETKEYASFKDWEQDKILAWVSSRISESGKRVEKDALLALEQVGGVNLRVLASEISKLLLYVGNRDVITLHDVTAVTSGGGASIFRFSEAFRDRNVPAMTLELDRLLNDGEEPLRLLGLIVSNVRLYFQLLTLAAERQSVQQMGKVLKKNPYFLKRLLPAVQRSYSLDRLRELYASLAILDRDIKTGKVAAGLGLQLVISQLYTPKRQVS